MIKQILFITLAIAGISAVDFTDCGSNGIIRDIMITNCTKSPCVFNKGQTYTTQIDFTPNITSNAATYKTTATVLVPITFTEGDACATLVNTTCPIKAGTPVTSRSNYTVPKDSPSVQNTTVKLIVTDNQSGATILCASLKVTVK